MTNIKMNLELGSLRLDYEGPAEFVSGDLTAFIEQLSKLELPDVVVAGNSAVQGLPPQEGGPQKTTASSKLSTTDFAVKMGVKSGTDLVMAASAYLYHTRGMEEYRRTDLLTEMKTAKAFYKSSYGGNLTKSLDTLIKSGRLQNPKADTYALPYSELEALRMLL